ncbi:hypothetical protein NQ317_009613 [Molorchus minor]|uniref:Uncharacterized protein n=1 Tax=Molorchus minor TaxID=1323400 RepID=A0ABQ9JJ70_9CUCU|nr:hypothetical protein NQ317_009613 [Molorchus minor]
MDILIVKEKIIALLCKRPHRLFRYFPAVYVRDCRARHHTLLHRTIAPENRSSSSHPAEELPSNSHSPVENIVNSNVLISQNHSETVLLSTAVVKVIDKWTREQNIRLNPKYQYSFEVFVVEKISGKLPYVPFNKDLYLHLKNLPLADSTFNIPRDIDGLLGASLFADILGTHKIVGTNPSPTAIETTLGYLVLGSAVQRDNTGRFTVALPFKLDPSQLGDSYSLAERRLFGLEKQLQKFPEQPHKQFHRVLWRFNLNDPISVYELNTVTFGVRSSPYLSLRIVKLLAESQANLYPKAVEYINRDMYMDDVIVSVPDVKTAYDLHNQLVDLFLSGSFHLLKWVSNSFELLSKIPDFLKLNKILDFDKTNLKILGLQWNPSLDKFNFKLNFEISNCTKRNLLSCLLIKRLWELKYDWDQEASLDITKLWSKFQSELHLLSNLQIPRLTIGHPLPSVSRAEFSHTHGRVMTVPLSTNPPAQPNNGDIERVTTITMIRLIHPYKAFEEPHGSCTRRMAIIIFAMAQGFFYQIGANAAYRDKTKSGKNVESPEQLLKELKEQYCRLQDDFKGKLTEVAGLRTNNEKLKDMAKAAEEAKKAMEEKFKELDAEFKKLKAECKGPKGNTKEQMIELEQQMAVAKQRFREAQDELEELRALVEDQQGQLDDYRNKYLEAQQKVDEQMRQIDLMEMENQRASEEVNMEILRVKNQFQEKLQELMPLPDILKSTQVKLQEAQQMHLLAERNNEALSRELQMYKDKIAAMTNQMDEAVCQNFRLHIKSLKSLNFSLPVPEV